jgi:hypothetical protein
MLISQRDLQLQCNEAHPGESRSSQIACSGLVGHCLVQAMRACCQLPACSFIFARWPPLEPAQVKTIDAKGNPKLGGSEVFSSEGYKRQRIEQERGTVSHAGSARQ